MIVNKGKEWKPIDKSRVQRILVRSTNWVGDAVMTIPAIEAVRENFPSSTLVVLARPWVAPLLENHPAVDQVWPFRRGGGFTADLHEWFRVIAGIRRFGFDLAFLLQNAFEAAILAWLGGIETRIGYNTDGRGLLLSHPLSRTPDIRGGHQVEYYLSILRSVGLEAESRDPRAFVAQGDRERMDEFLVSKGVLREDFILGLSPGAIYGPAKRWPPERFAAIGDRAVERWGAKVLVLGSPREKEICSSVRRFMKHGSLDLCGMTTLGEAMALIQRCRLFLTNDSGLMHIGAALNVPLVAVFGSTDPTATGPRGEKARILRRETGCSPCLKPECPTDFHCMLDIEPDAVWKEMENVREEFLS
ncbi:MAG: lipopolysaccharide heptosyltransferase II [Pseudomonadota bacterium]